VLPSPNATGGADGDLGVAEVGEERVLLEDRVARPAAGPVELHDDVALVLELEIVDTVLETVEREAVPPSARSPPLRRRG
jgi:hypothetical protein